MGKMGYRELNRKNSGISPFNSQGVINSQTFLDEISNKQNQLINYHVNLERKQRLLDKKSNEIIVKQDQITQNLDDLKTFKKYHKVGVLAKRKERVNKLLLIYKDSARDILYGNIQGQLFSKYKVNRYEDLLIIHYPYILDEIERWTPKGDLYLKLEEYRRDKEKGKDTQQKFDFAEK